MVEAGNDTFLLPNLELLTVLFYTNYGQVTDLRLAVVQTRWALEANTEASEVMIYSYSDRVGAEGSNYSSCSWLMTSDSLLLTDPVTGERAGLMPGGLDEDEAESERWAGTMPKSEAGPLCKFDQGPGPDWLRDELYYEAGQLHRADTSQALTLQLFLAPERSA